MRWFTADLHFGHANILRYCDRPFAGVDEMDDALIDEWNSVVATDDEVWVLGDVALGPIAETLPKVARLHGRKVLLTGNHDRCWRHHGDRAAQWEPRYREAGFDAIAHDVVTFTLHGHEVRASHFPYHGDSHDHDRFTAHRPTDTGGWLLHGHVHERWRQLGRQINVGVDAWAYRPVAEDEIVDLIEAGPADRAPLPESD